jgi:hypothetical protein
MELCQVFCQIYGVIPSFAKNIKLCVSFAKFMELCQVLPNLWSYAMFFAKFLELFQVLPKI